MASATVFVLRPCSLICGPSARAAWPARSRSKACSCEENRFVAAGSAGLRIALITSEAGALVFSEGLADAGGGLAIRFALALRLPLRAGFCAGFPGFAGPLFRRRLARGPTFAGRRARARR